MKNISEVTQMGDGITRLRAANPSAMTGSGTNSYVVRGAIGAVVIDPGPDLDQHLEAILRELDGRPLEAILITHAHLDHTALVPRLVERSGAAVLAYGRADEGRSERMQLLALAGSIDGGEGLDLAFAPDKKIRHAEMLRFDGLEIEVFATPGHLSGHLSFAYLNQLFSGDHVMGWSTSLISPPDGDMGAYMGSLAALQHRNWLRFLPGHGPEVTDPAARLATLIAHRKEREAAILFSLKTGPATAKSLATRIYTDISSNLLPAAARNILAHLIDLQDRNHVQTQDLLSVCARFELI